ncbi:MAG: lipopolysaccharide biosynthesis protein [Candidatus Wenzhouxiangella sp. M2_3B_020]
MAPGRPGPRRGLTGPIRRLLSGRVPRAGAAAGGIRVAGRLVVFALQVFLARAIVDQAEFGTYAWGQNLLFLLGGIFALGLPVAASRLVAVHFQRHDGPAERAVVRRGLGLLGAISAGLAIVGVVLLWLLPTGTLAGIPRGIAFIAVAAAPLVAFTLFNQAVARARMRLLAAFGPTQVLRPMLTGALALGIVLATGSSLTGEQALIAVVGSLVLVLVVQAFVGGPSSSGRTPAADSGDADEYAPRRLMTDALPIFATRVSDLVVKHSGVLVLGFVASPALVGGFFVAERLAQLAALPMLVIGAVIQPWLASAHAAGDRAGLQQVVTQAIHTALWPTLAGAVVIQAAAGVLLGLFGEGFVDAAPILAVLMLAHIVAAVLGPNPQILIMSGRPGTAFRISATSAVLHIVLLAVLVPAFGAIGAAWATLVSTAVAGGAALWIVRSRLGLRSSILLGAGLARRDPAT